jgi:hypothetical protein
MLGRRGRIDDDEEIRNIVTCLPPLVINKGASAAQRRSTKMAAIA